MADLFGKDLDNLKKHMGGGDRRRNKKDDRAKPKFQYEQEKEVFVCINGQLKTPDSVIRCKVHDINSIDELRARIGMLLFDDKPVKRVFMEDGVELFCLSLLHDRDILYATCDHEEPFYGAVLKPKEPCKDQEIVSPTPSVVKDDNENNNKITNNNKAHRPRPFKRPELQEEIQESAKQQSDTSSVPNQAVRNVVDKYGGTEYFQHSDMLVPVPQPLPAFLSAKPQPKMKPSEEQVWNSIKSNVDYDPSVGRKNLKRAGLLVSTELAIKELLKLTENKIGQKKHRKYY